MSWAISRQGVTQTIKIKPQAKLIMTNQLFSATLDAMYFIMREICWADNLMCIITCFIISLLLQPTVIKLSPDHCCYFQLHHPTHYWDDLPMAKTNFLDDNRSSCLSPFEDDRSVYHPAITFNQLSESLLVTVQGYNLSCQLRHLLVYFDVQETNTSIKARQCGLQAVSGDHKSPQSECQFVCHLIGLHELPVVIHIALQTHRWDPPFVKKSRLCEVNFHTIGWEHCLVNVAWRFKACSVP